MTFQTLIGTVKSEFEVGRLAYELSVSNPHRYGQKTERQGYPAVVETVSNPHRYGQKASCRASSMTMLKGFKPS